MKKFIWIFIPSLLIGGIYDYLKIPVSSKEGALFDLCGIFGTLPSAFLVNPASLFETKKVLEAGYGNYILDMHQGYLAYSFTKDTSPFLGVGVCFFHLGEFTKTDTFGWEIGKYTGQNIALNICFPIMRKYKMAGSFEFYYNHLDEYNSLGTAISLGWNFLEKEAFKDGVFRNSLVLKHIGFEIKPFEKERAEFPITFLYIAGLKFRTFETALSLLYTLNEGFDLKFSYLYRWGKYLKVGVGYTTAYRDVNVEENIKNLISGLVGGIGIDVKKVSLFYSYTPFGILGDIHRIDISYAF